MAGMTSEDRVGPSYRIFLSFPVGCARSPPIRRDVRMLSTLDWSLILAYIAFALIVGVLTSRAASKSLASYFVAGRSLPWWWIGTSMVATTFASDTPLVVAGIVAKRGISGNWFWWAWVIGNVGVAVFFAPLWRRAGVVTDAELIELRYGSGPGAFLRGFKAVYSSLIVNIIVLGWVFRAMAKIAEPFLRWEEILPSNLWTAVEANWPAVLTMGSVNESLTVALLVLMIALYASAGGIRGVMLTDLFQFVIAMAGSCLFAWYAVEAVGGLSGLSAKLGEIYGAEGAANIISFLPPEGAGWAGAQVILIYLFVVWWAHNNADGGGYIGQRLCSARSPRDAQAGAFLFTVGNYVLRPWPWILIGLVSLVLVPKGMDALPGTMEAKILADREAAYPLLMEKLLPAGVLGLVLVGLLGAFMSTVDTHLNWGMSYLVNDVYARFIRKGAGAREVVFVSRLGVLIMAVGAFAVAGQIKSIEVAWKFHISLGAGLGLPVILRWLWWRANAWTEISGMLAAGATALYLHWEGKPPAFPVLLAAEVGVGFLVMLIVTFITRPARPEVLRNFWAQVHPPGAWGRVRGEDRRAAPVSALAGLWICMSVFVFALMFLVGALLVGTWAQAGGLALLAGFALCMAWGIDRRYRYGILFV